MIRGDGGDGAFRMLALVLGIAVGAVGCTDRSPSEPPTSQSPDVTAAIGQDATEAAEAAEAANLRLDLERRFAAGAHLALEATRARGGSQDAALAALRSEGRAVGAALADADAEGLPEVWRRYLEAILQYGDADERDEARRGVRRAVTAVAEVMAARTDGGMEAQGTAGLLRAPTSRMLRSLDAYADREFGEAYAADREAFAEMVTMGTAFAAGLTERFGDRYPGVRSSGAIELRSAMQQLLGEHSLAAATMMRRGSHGARDFEEAGAALNGNTQDLDAALQSVYGSDTAPLTARWRDRISELANYTVALTEDEDGDRRDARRRLRRSDRQIGSLFDDITSGQAAGDDITEALHRHTDALLAQIDAYVAERFAEAERHKLAAHAQSLTLAQIVGEGVAADRPEEFPAR